MDKTNHIKLASWPDIFARIHQCNPKLAERLDAESKHPSVYLDSFKYGEKIQIPDNCTVGLLLNKQVECFMNVNERIVPLEIKQPGELITGHNAPWEMTAGVRTIYSTVKISEKRRHLKLAKHFPMTTAPPRRLNEHWGVFRDIAAASDWRCEVLFFDDCFETGSSGIACGNPQDDDLISKSTHHDVFPRLDRGIQLQTNDFLRNPIIRDCIFSKIESQINFRYHPNILSFARHIIGMAAHMALGLSFDIDETALPKTFIQQAYLEHYQLDYAPILMGISKTGNQYFSLAAPHCADFNPTLSANTGPITELRELQYMIQKMQAAQNQDCQYLSNALKATIRYFHQQSEPASQIQATNQIEKYDLALQQELKHFPDHPFCVYGSLVNGLAGCVSKQQIAES